MTANVLIGILLNSPHLLSPVVMWVPAWFNALAAEFSKGSFSLVCQTYSMGRPNYTLSVLFCSDPKPILSSCHSSVEPCPGVNPICLGDVLSSETQGCAL